MKKKLLSVILIMVALVLTGCTKIPLAVGDYSVVYEREMPAMQLDENSAFSILQITDTHLVDGNNKDDKTTLQNLNRILSQKNYDLVILTGDIFDGFTNRSYDKPSAVASIIKLFDDNLQKYTYIAGNNDGETLGSDKDVVLQLLTSEHFVFADHPVQGCGNFYISLANGDGVEQHRLVMFDTSHRDEDGNYIAIGQDQIDWYQKIAKECADKSIKLSLFGHIPFNNIENVIKQGAAVQGDNNLNGIKEFWGDMGNGNDALFRAVKDSGVCSLVVNGHMHNVDVAKNYENMIYKITRASGVYQKLGTDFLNGVCEITIRPTESELNNTYFFNTLTY